MARTDQEASKATSQKRKTSATASSSKKPATKSVKSSSKGTAKSAAKTTTRKAGGGKPRVAKMVRVTTEQRHALIAEAAYLRAEQRGFGGDPTEHWLSAEQEVDASLAERAIAS